MYKLLLSVIFIINLYAENKATVNLCQKIMVKELWNLIKSLMG